MLVNFLYKTYCALCCFIGINKFGFLQKIMKYDRSSVLCEACSASKILISVTYMGSNLQALIKLGPLYFTEHNLFCAVLLASIS